MTGFRVTLSERAQAWCDLAGMRRHDAGRAAARTHTFPQASTARALRQEATGIAAEQVVRFYLGEPCFLEHTEPDRFDVLAGGVRIDVKATEWEHGVLRSNVHSNSIADVYVLVVRKFTTYTVAGWATAKELKDAGNLGRHFPDAYSMPQEELRAAGDLDEYTCAGIRRVGA